MARQNVRRSSGAALRVAGLIVGLAVGPLAAHPHIWIDTGVEVILDAEGRVSAVRVQWDYDEFYSLLLIEERGLDADHDGTASEAERAALNGFDMNWIAGFEGDTYLRRADQPVTLSAPQDWTADYREGRLRSTHLRRIEPPLPLDQPLTLSVYDPGYYSAYALPQAPRFTPALPEGCDVTLQKPDPATVDQRLLDLLASYGPDQDPEEDFPAVGAQFAHGFVVTCG